MYVGVFGRKKGDGDTFIAGTNPHVCRDTAEQAAKTYDEYVR